MNSLLQYLNIGEGPRSGLLIHRGNTDILDDPFDTTHRRLMQWQRWAHRRSGHDFSREIEAVEKAVGHLQFKPVQDPEPLLKAVIVAHYLEDLDLHAMSERFGISEFHCEQAFRRAVRMLASSIPAWDRVLT